MHRLAGSQKFQRTCIKISLTKNKNNMNLEEFKIEINKISKKGYMKSMRSGNTGVGHTLEQKLGLTENNIAGPDLEKIELKTQRKNVSNRVTMFTFNRGAWQQKQNYIVEKYGYKDEDERPALYCTVNNNPNPQGLFLEIDKNNDLMLLKHIDKVVLGQWKLTHLTEQFEKKMPNLMVVFADTKLNEKNEEEFWYNEAYLLENVNSKIFLDYIEKGIIIMDIRIHLKPNGTVRNHGTAFRIEEKYLIDCFLHKGKII
ncbi:MAG: MvaI/BcnI family restriction endonuclease [Elusimicrobiota bacterium]